MNTQICGHDREALRWALDVSAQTDAGRTVLVMAGHRQSKTAKATAYESVHDPAKLAAIIAELLRERDLSVNGDECHEKQTYADVDVRGAVIAVATCDPDGHEAHASLSVHQARRFALALLDAPANANVEQMIAEVAR